jgi:phosphate transport system protein
MHSDPPAPPYRDRFHDTLEQLEGNLQTQGAMVRAALARATRGLVTGNAALCGAVIAGDDEVDCSYLDIERQVVHLLGHYAPVASDLRLLTAALHINLPMEAFDARDARGSQRLPTLDALVDELNRSLLAAVLAPGQPLDQLAWVVYLHDAGRQLERAADHAVDIAEQVWFLVTGELVEFDSAPRVPTPAS